MDEATSTKSNKIFNALTFSLLSENEKDYYKSNLVCIECGGKASFRKASTDGKSPCFSAKHKIKNCNRSRSSNSTSNIKGTNEVNIKIADSNTIGIKKINYFSTSNLEDNLEPDEYNFSENGKNSNHYTIEPSRNIMKNWSLSKILNHQLNDSFADTHLTIRYNNEMVPVNKILFNWNNINELQEGLYWGYISSYNDCWLNSDSSYPYNSFSIQLDKAIDEIIWKCIPQKIGSWNRNVPTIVRGTPMRSLNGKLYIKITDITCIYIDKRCYKSAIKDHAHD